MDSNRLLNTLFFNNLNNHLSNLNLHESRKKNVLFYKVGEINLHEITELLLKFITVSLSSSNKRSRKI